MAENGDDWIDLAVADEANNQIGAWPEIELRLIVSIAFSYFVLLLHGFLGLYGNGPNYSRKLMGLESLPIFESINLQKETVASVKCQHSTVEYEAHKIMRPEEEKISSSDGVKSKYISTCYLMR